MKKQYIFPQTEVIALGAERIMSTDSISNIAPLDPGLAPARRVEVF